MTWCFLSLLYTKQPDNPFKNCSTELLNRIVWQNRPIEPFNKIVWQNQMEKFFNKIVQPVWFAELFDKIVWLNVWQNHLTELFVRIADIIQPICLTEHFNKIVQHHCSTDCWKELFNKIFWQFIQWNHSTEQFDRVIHENSMSHVKSLLILQSFRKFNLWYT